MRTWEAREVPGVRDGLVKVLEGASGYFAEKMIDSAGKTEAEAKPLGEKFVKYHQSQLRGSELFHVSAQMTELAVVAMGTLPDFRLQIEDLPAPCGFLVSEAPLGTRGYDGIDTRISVGAVSWLVLPERGEINFHVWEDEQEFREAVDRLDGTAPPVNERPAFLIPNLEYRLPLDTEFSSESTSGFGDDHDDVFRITDVIRTIWLLMQQPLAQEEPVHYDRAARRRAAREGRELPPVRVITLRRARREGADTSTGSGREYHHQWLVGGHWRQQWYAKRQVHRPVWIAPYVKGPAGAPILGSEKVYALRK